MAKDALPDRYVVDRKGSPDPAASQYYVLDVVHDRHARTVLGRLVNYYRQYGQVVAADELVALLDETTDAHREFIVKQAKAPLQKTTTSRSKKTTTTGRM